MPEGIWEEVAMTCIENCDTKNYANYSNVGGVVVRESVYEAKMPETVNSMDVQFYAVGQDSRLAYAFGGGFVYTGYGSAEPVEVFVDDIVGFGNPILDFIGVAMMMGLMYGVVWGGLYKTVGIATEAEKRKNEGEAVNKIPRKQAQPPTKPPKKPSERRIAAIPKGE